MGHPERTALELTVSLMQCGAVRKINCKTGVSGEQLEVQFK